MKDIVLVFDTSNEVISIGIGRLNVQDKTIDLVAECKHEAHRASNTRLLPSIDTLMKDASIANKDIACVAVGRGPGSFTGVRIAMSTAKGIAQALGCPLVGVSTQEAIAWSMQEDGLRGRALVVSDAMRKEVYPSLFDLTDSGIVRLSPDSVIKVKDFTDKALNDGLSTLMFDVAIDDTLPQVTSKYMDHIGGDALTKYLDEFEGLGEVVDKKLWTASGRSLLACVQYVWQSGKDILDVSQFNPAILLPIYTRLSDAEENERARAAITTERDLTSGVGSKIDCLNDDGVHIRPLDNLHVSNVTELEKASMGTDAWSEESFLHDIKAKSRTWWMAISDDELLGYAGVLVAGDVAEILKIAVNLNARRKGLASALLERALRDAVNLGASKVFLEVRESNTGAIAFYSSLGLSIEASRRRYYSDGEDAYVMSADLENVLVKLESSAGKVAGMQLETGELKTDQTEADVLEIADVDEVYKTCETRKRLGKHPLILAIESSCDETAAAVVDSNGEILSSIVASQVDFHARFGGVVPEIASRKHVEAICGVVDVALERAALYDDANLDATLNTSLDAHSDSTLDTTVDTTVDTTAHVKWEDLDAIAATYAPGLVGALVVGVAFAKGAAWALEIPYIEVNHLEGHLYANKLACTPDDPFEPPALVSLVSGGNTLLVHMSDWQKYDVVGQTIDDAVGEAFDKVAKALGLPYPGGAEISRLAKSGDPSAIAFPRALMHSGDLRFSLSGLKTAVITYIERELEEKGSLNVADICASFQQAVIDVQISKARTALKTTGATTMCLGGGVAANDALRDAYVSMCEEEGVRLVMPPMNVCGDNAAMIALVAYDRYKQGKFSPIDSDAYAHADLAEPY